MGGANGAYGSKGGAYVSNEGVYVSKRSAHGSKMGAYVLHRARTSGRETSGEKLGMIWAKET
jgi:hypothetical protein